MRKKMKLIIITLSVLILGTAGYYAYAIYDFANEIQAKPKETHIKDTKPTPEAPKAPPKWEGKDRVNLLLLGGDARGLDAGASARADTIMVVSMDPLTKKAHLFSILRDTYVDIPNYGKQRINAALSLGDPTLAMETVSNFLGIPIQHYVYTDFLGFIALVDAMGGIDFEVEKDMKYSDSADGHQYDIDLKEGMQHLDGNAALQYVRFRHDATSDYSRTERQRNLLQALAKELQTTSSLLKLPRILSSIDPYIETNLTMVEMLRLGSLGYEAKAEGIVSQQLPPSNLLVETKIGGSSVITVDQQLLQQFVQMKFEENAVEQVDSTGETGLQRQAYE